MLSLPVLFQRFQTVAGRHAQIVEPLYVSNQPSTPDLVRDFGVGVVGWALAGAFLVVLYSLIRAPQRR